jgi:proteasome lid subunit RPN8/RPN11
MYVNSLSLAKAQYELMLNHVQENMTEEVCGLIAGKDGVVKVVKPITNIEQNRNRFRMDPQEQVDALIAFEKNGWRLLGIYHSHPNGPGEMSRADHSLSAYPEAVFLLWFPVRFGWHCRAFCWMENQFVEIPLFVEGEEIASGEESFGGW